MVVEGEIHLSSELRNMTAEFFGHCLESLAFEEEATTLKP